MEETKAERRPVDMNAYLSYYSASRMQAGTQRDPHLKLVQPEIELPPVPESLRGLRETLGRIAKTFHRRKNLVAVS